MPPVTRRFARLLAAMLAIAAPGAATPPAEILDAVGGLPAHIVARFQDPIAFVQATTGDYLVLDRRSHRIYGIDRGRTKVTTVLEIGGEGGKVLGPAVLSLAPADVFAVADAPGGHERLQYFTLGGQFVNGFYLNSRMAPRLQMDSLVLSGVGSMHFTGSTFLLNRPELGAIVAEYDLQGQVTRLIGELRKTEHEADRDLHLAFNSGMPLVDPAGGFFFVFQTGRPLFRKYDATGALVFERHIEGVELDGELRAMPEAWPRRPDEARLPIVPPLVRTAAVDPHGQLWVSLRAPYTYVYNRQGDKVRTVQFRGARIIDARSLAFPSADRLLVTPGCYEFKVN
jgi:hypothetical protein